MPVVPFCSSTEPALYQIMCATVGARWSSLTMIFMPFFNMNSCAGSACTATGDQPNAHAASSTAIRIFIVCALIKYLTGFTRRVLDGANCKKGSDCSVFPGSRRAPPDAPPTAYLPWTHV